MKLTKFVALGIAGAALSVGAGPVVAVDAREVVVEKSEGLVEVPRHLGHVLSSPNRSFSPQVGPEDAHWMVYKDFGRPGVFNDPKARLRHPDNLFYQVTYFDFDEDEPVGAEMVAARLRHQLGPMSDEGLTFLLVGHSDEAGAQSYNKALSIRRATAIKDLLVEAGHSPDAFQIVGRGKLDPLSFKDQAKNRRVEVIVRGDKQAKDRFKKMRRGGGAVTCRSCLNTDAPAPHAPKPHSLTDASAQPIRPSGNATPAPQPINQMPIGREEIRQPTLPASNGIAVEVEPTEPSLTSGSATIQRLRSQQASDAGARQGFRADQNPMGVLDSVQPAPSLHELLSQ